MTAGGEWTVEGDADGVMKPTAINLRQQGYSGSSTVTPIVIGNSALFVQARGSVVRDLKYDLQSDGYTGRDLTIFANHLFDGYTITSWAFQQIPHSILWVTRSDGALLGLTYLPDQEVWGWHRHDTGREDSEDDTFNRLCTVPEGTEDAIYSVVTRTNIDGDTKKYIERLHTRNFDDIEDAWFLDCALEYDGTNDNETLTMTLTTGAGWTLTDDLTLTASSAYFSSGDIGNTVVLIVDGVELELTVMAYTSTTVVSVMASADVVAAFRSTAIATWEKGVDEITGLDHLEGRVVGVLAEGNALDTYTVTGGAILLDRPYTKVIAGLPITADFETLDLESVSSETLIDKKKLVGKVTLLVDASRGISAGQDLDHLTEYKQRADETYDEATNTVTGTVEIALSATWNGNGRVAVRKSDPTPLTILAAVPSGMIGSR